MSQVETLEVVGGCECGCASIDFRTTGAGERKILADAMAIYPDAQEAGLILWGSEREIAGLEFYELDPVAERIPQLDYLRRFNAPATKQQSQE